MSLSQVCKMSRMASGEGAGKTVLDFTVKSLSGEAVELDRYRGRVILIENVASL